MASVVEESYDSLPPAQQAALVLQRQQLLQHIEDQDDARETDEQQAPTMPPSAPARSHGDAPDARAPTIPDSLNIHRSLPRPSPPPRKPNGIAKAASFTGGAGHYSQGGDTQPVDSQVYHRYSELESMREEPADATPQKLQSAAGTSPETLAEDVDQTPQHTLQQGDAGYIDLDGVWQKDTSPTTSFANYDEELLDADTAKSPDTQFFEPHRPEMPETPALAEHIHGRDGEPLTSATTAPRFSQFFPQERTMGATQLFAQTQEPSSPPANGEPSDDAMTRPSPITNGATSSPRTTFSSPVVTKHIRTSSGVGEPRTEYRSMKESQEERERRLRAGENGPPDELQEDSDEDDTQQNRFRARQLRRSRSEQALKEAASVSAPPRGGWIPSSARKSVVDLVTPATTRRRVSFDDIIEEAEDETQLELPEELGTNNEDDRDEDEDAAASQHDDDQYDELQEKVIRSQSNFQVDEDDSASFVGSIQENGVEVPNNDEPLDDTQDPNDADSDIGEDELQDPRGELHDTQRSTIADSQPLAHAHDVQRILTPHTHHSSMASFVPGSQYTGKTSQDQAFLKMSHPSQVRVAASQAEKVPSSPPLPRASVVNPAETPSALQEILQLPQTRQESTRDDSASPQEVPESDAAGEAVQKPRNEARANGLGEEESNNLVPFSTAQTHVSASMRSPTKSVAADSPMRAFRSQQTETPRKAFSDMITGPKAMNASFDFGDVDDIMAGVMTKEDEDVLAVLSTPKPKRRKTNHNVPSSSTLPSGHATSDQSLREQSDTSRTIQDSEPDFARPAIPAKIHPDKHAEIDVLTESVATSERAGTIPESEHDLVAVESRDPVLRDSPNKANVLPIPPPEESGKARSSTPDSAKQREDAGFRHVAQLISTTRSSSPASKKGKLKTPGRAARRKSDKTGANVSKKTSRAQSRHTDDIDELGDGEVDMEEAAKETELVDNINRTDTTPPPADRVHQDFADNSLPTLDNLANEEPAEHRDTDNTFPAPERLWALFRGTPSNYYPATWIAGSSDGLSCKVRFDDETTTNIDTWLVRALDLRIGDQVKVDNGVGSRSTTWRIVGYGAVAGGVKNHELRTDTRGHTHVKVQATSNRNSKGGATTENADEVREVWVSDLYLTSGMWKNYKDREFIPPVTAKTMVSRPGTPSSRLQTPTGDTPSSRSRRNGLVVSKTKKKVGTSHLRDASVASSTSAGAGAIFSEMAFAVTYISDDAEKAQVTRMIQRNGGIILEDGFGELFDIPNIGEPVASPSKKSPRKDAEEEPRELGLHLKLKYDNCGFVALIADRHSRRAKYMQALALDLPTLSGRWVLDSLNAEKNPTLSTPEIEPLPWGKYLLPAGESSYLGGAIRSRVMLPYDATSTQLRVTVNNRPQLLNDEGVLIVAPKKDKVAWERRKTYAFLTLALGAGMVERVNDLQDAKSMMDADPKIWKWIYVDGKIEEAFANLCGKTAGGKKRKRASEAASDDGAKMSVTDGMVTVVNDEFVVQSLILGALAE